MPDIVQNTARAGSYGPYGRDVPIPRQLEDVTAEWLGGLMANRYPGLVIEAMETVDLHNSHTTNLRVAVEYNAVRSEEHTSELQSLMRISYAVFCLKKKTKTKAKSTKTTRN